MALIKHKNPPGARTSRVWLMALAACLFNPLPGWHEHARGDESMGNTYYVRSTLGQDHFDGGSPDRAWKSIRRAARDLGPGDTLIIGPGLYREGIELNGAGLPDRPLRFLGDPSGKLTGDPPGAVVLAGAEPVDESRFEPEGSPGVYQAHFPDFKAVGVTEMDGDQHRYRSVHDPISDIPYVERVRMEKRSFWYEEDTGMLYIHTSDEQAPDSHELEIIKFHSGFRLVGKPHVWFSGLTFRHYQDAGVHFRDGSDYGRAFNNVAFGSRQGFRILRSSHVAIVDNVMFRHENSGAYFLRGSVNGLLEGNLTYENAVGLRFSSSSNAGLVLGNTVLDNRDGGLSFESMSYAVALHNRFRGNSAQLRLYESSFLSDYNCYEVDADSGSLLAKLRLTIEFASLDAFVAAEGQDRNSKDENCGIDSEKMDVVALHQTMQTYRERALEKLASQ